MSTVFVLAKDDKAFDELTSHLNEEGDLHVIRLSEAGDIRKFGKDVVEDALILSRAGYPGEGTWAEENGRGAIRPDACLKVRDGRGLFPMPAGGVGLGWMGRTSGRPAMRAVGDHLTDAPVYGGSFFREGYYDGREAACAVREMIQYNYMTGDAAREYARRVHLSLTYLCRVFREVNGESIGKTIHRTRMEKAADMLRTSNMSVREVGETVGIQNFSYFCKRFRAYYHMTPNEYRKRSRNGDLPVPETEAEEGEAK